MYYPNRVVDFKNILNHPSDIVVKKFGDYHILKYDKQQLRYDTIKTTGLFRSIITHNDKIIAFAPPKSIYFDDFITENNIEDCYFQEFVEGTMINVFWDTSIEDWNLATKSNIGAKCKYNVTSDKTFRYMFLDAMNHCGLEFSHLNKNYVYSFVLQHPENRIVIPIMEPKIYLAAVYMIHNDNSIEKINDYNIEKIRLIKVKTFDDIKLSIGDTWQRIKNYFNDENLDYKNHGLVVYNNKGERMKIRSKNYEKVKMLKGNTPKMQYHYYTLRQNGAVKDFLRFYPEYKDQFRKLRKEMHDFTNQLYQYYIECYIKKEKKVKEYPYNYKIHMFNLHKHYIDNLRLEKKFISKQEVIDYVNRIHPAKLMHSINHIYNKFKLDTKITESLSKDV